MPAGVLTVVTLNMEEKLREPLLGMNWLVAPGGKPVSDRAKVGNPIRVDPGLRFMVTVKEFFPVVKTSRLLGTVTVKS